MSQEQSAPDKLKITKKGVINFTPFLDLYSKFHQKFSKQRHPEP